MNLSVPLKNKAKYSNLKFIESLDLDFWKYDKKMKSHTPVNFICILPINIAKKKKIFEFSELINKIKEIKLVNYFLYLGSQTVPPCKGNKSLKLENVFHVYVSKPLKISNCQFKLLRRNSIISDRPKEIHARLAQNTNKRTIYSFNQLDKVSNLEKDIPEEYFDLNLELYNKNLLKKKLSNLSTQKLLKTMKGLNNLNDISKVLKKHTFNGVNVHRLLHEHEQEGDSDC